MLRRPPRSTLFSLHDALPISSRLSTARCRRSRRPARASANESCRAAGRDRKSTRLNSSHRCISYAVFCLKKKKEEKHILTVVERQDHGATPTRPCVHHVLNAQ